MRALPKSFLNKKFRRNFGHDQSGVAAVEFAAFVLPFLLVMMGIVEVGLENFNAEMIENATDSAARQVRTGAAQGSSNPLQAFETALCADLVMITCSDLVIQSQSFGSFSAASQAPPPTYDKNGKMISSGFDPGVSGSIVVATVSYQYKFLTPLVGPLLSGSTSNLLLIQSTAVFANEPYDPTAG